MTSFSGEIRSFIASLTKGPVKTDTKGMFPVIHAPGSEILVQAVGVETYNRQSTGTTYFQQQSEQLAREGKLLIHCWEDLWISKNRIIRSRLESLFGKSIPIHGRKCKVADITKEDMHSFLDEHHLTGTARGKYRLGLWHEGHLVAVALFARSIPIQRDGETFRSHEMIRYCSRCGTYVQGGLSKLIRHFIAGTHPQDIYTVVDRDWSDGSGFMKLGFEKVGTSAPIKFWLDQEGNRHRIKPFEGAREVLNSGNVKLLLTLKDEDE